MGGGASKWRRVVKKIGFPCASFAREIPRNLTSRTISISAAENERTAPEEAEQSGLAAKSLCAICLEPLSCCDGTVTSAYSADGQAIFTAECTHTFHFACIASNVRHGSVTCPICRAHWSHLPRHHLTTAYAQTTTDPILRILEDSIATSRFNRRSTLRSTRLYDDDEPIDPPPPSAASSRLHLALIPTTAASPHRLYLSVKLSHQQPTDLVLVVSPNGPHLRLLKQAMALVVFLLRADDRLAIVTYSAAAATRTFPLRRMSPNGKQAALRVIDRLFYLGPTANPIEGIQKGVKVLEDRTHQNPNSSILHLSDSPAAGAVLRLQIPVPVHRFHVGFGTSNGFVMHEFEEFLGRLLGAVIRETQLRIGEEGEWVRVGEVRGGEKRQIPLDLRGDCRFVCIGYSYIEGGAEESLVTGEAVVGVQEKGEERGNNDGEREIVSDGERRSCVERWDYLDPFMARRWAKHLHGYRLN